MKQRVLAVCLVGLVAAIAASAGQTARAVNISGAWNFSVDLESGGHGDPTFVLKHEGAKLTGTYNGPLGEYKVTGSVTGVRAVFGYDFTQDGQTGKATYTGTIESPTKMTGTVEFTGGARGKWTATKRE